MLGKDGAQLPRIGHSRYRALFRQSLAFKCQVKMTHATQFVGTADLPQVSGFAGLPAGTSEPGHRRSSTHRNRGTPRRFQAVL